MTAERGSASSPKTDLKRATPAAAQGSDGKQRNASSEIFETHGANYVVESSIFPAVGQSLLNTFITTQATRSNPADPPLSPLPPASSAAPVASFPSLRIMVFGGKGKKSPSEDEEVSINLQRADAQPEAVADGVFGVQEEGAPNYVNVGWIRAAILLMKAQIGLGVLGIPGVFSTIGLIPGLWSSFVVGRYKARHPEVHSIADVGYILAGRFGKEFLGAIYMAYMICIAGSGMLSVAISLNTLSEHGACTVVFVVVAAIAVFLLASIQTLDRVSFLGWIGLVSIMVSMLTLAIAVGVQDRPAAAPAAPAPWDKNFKLFGSPTFAEAGAALGTVTFAFGGTPAFFNVVAEMRNPSDFPKTVAMCQSYVTAVYAVIGIVVYYYCGDYVASPALGSAGPLLKKVCYGIAIPALIVGSVIYIHMPAKYLFVRFFRGSRHLASSTPQHWMGWLGSTLACTVIGFVIAEGIPVFSGLVGLGKFLELCFGEIGALFGTFMSLQVMGCMWLSDHNWGARNAERRKNKSFTYRFLVVWNYFLILGGSFITVAGTYGSIVGIINDYAGKSLTAFSCADNS
ncbi:transmembrane amino acid transporter protein-domain-containing protein [Leucosporidium creatinivorum]|uniref:Transmembrane amino acid transporter protein-domain-containing protein n=1 Tax=Leucosporidium creatinivorum TaxID=106004 RepID=A0A1Y2FX01_9BASI|nr:transmembrane amino acid transporter protein-domain-containing protein [Leucosporidium creatinivorum]